jgi:large subunit ribosomal protein L6
MKEKLKELKREMEIPTDIEVEVKNNEIHAKKEDKEIRKRFPKVLVEKQENKIVIKTKRSTKREKKQINTIYSHIENIFQGLKEKFVYKLQVCSVHFPMNVSIKDDEIIIKNFLGETKERKAKILSGADVKIEKDIITVESVNKELAGQTAANIEKAAEQKGRDKRIFQDGVFMIEKAGRKI